MDEKDNVVALVPRKVGRPTAFLPEYAAQVEKLCILGATDEEIADFLNVDVRTVYRWKKSNPEFCQAVKNGKMLADQAVAQRLNERAMGFEYEEAVPIKLKEVIYENGKRVKETERVEVVNVQRVVPPDTTAAIFWLKNRRPEQWRDKQSVEIGLEASFAALLIEGAKRGRNPSAA